MSSFILRKKRLSIKTNEGRKERFICESRDRDCTSASAEKRRERGRVSLMARLEGCLLSFPSRLDKAIQGLHGCWLQRRARQREPWISMSKRYSVPTSNSRALPELSISLYFTRREKKSWLLAYFLHAHTRRFLFTLPGCLTRSATGWLYGLESLPCVNLPG